MGNLLRWCSLFNGVERIEAQNAAILNQLKELGVQMSADAQAINTQLGQLESKLDKIAAEVAAIQPGMTPEETAAVKSRIAALIGKADAIDALNPDTPAV